MINRVPPFDTQNVLFQQLLELKGMVYLMGHGHLYGIILHGDSEYAHHFAIWDLHNAFCIVKVILWAKRGPTSWHGGTPTLLGTAPTGVGETRYCREGGTPPLTVSSVVVWLLLIRQGPFYSSASLPLLNSGPFWAMLGCLWANLWGPFRLKITVGGVKGLWKGRRNLWAKWTCSWCSPHPKTPIYPPLPFRCTIPLKWG